MKPTNLNDIAPPQRGSFLPADLVVDPKMQRDVIDIHLQRLTDDYNVALVGTLVISRRASGAKVILDGQHRWRAAQVADPNTELEVLMFHDLTPAQEADLFLGFNDTATVDSVSKFRLGVIAGNPDLVAIHNVFEQAGIDTQSSQNAAGYSAIATAIRVSKWKGGLKTLYRTLNLLGTVFPTFSRNNRPWRREIVEGLALLLHVHPHLDDDRLIKELRRRGEEWSGQLMAAVTHARTVNNSSSTYNVAGTLTHWYNRGLRGSNKALEQWNFSKRVNVRTEPGSADVLNQPKRGKALRDAGTPEPDEGKYDEFVAPEFVA